MAALAAATIAIVVTAGIFALGLTASGVPSAGAGLYSISLAALAFAFAGLASLIAQLTSHSRGVYLWGLVVVAASYVLRGVGDVTGTWLTWLSPLGWAEKAAPFATQRWWTVAIPLTVGSVTGGTSTYLASRRDLGSSLVRGRSGPSRAQIALRSSVGLAAWNQRATILGWLVGSIMLAAMIGALAQQLVDAVAGNPSMGDAIGISGEVRSGIDGVVLSYLAIVASGYLVSALGVLRSEETAGRVETQLAGTLTRRRWLAGHVAVALVGLLANVVIGSLVLGLTSAWSLADPTVIWPCLRAGLAYLPAELVLGGTAVALFGARPRTFPIAWAVYAATAFVAFLGSGLKLPGWVMDLTPTTHLSNPLDATASSTGIAILSAISVALFVVGFETFTRRGIPQV